MKASSQTQHVSSQVSQVGHVLVVEPDVGRRRIVDHELDLDFEMVDVRFAPDSGLGRRILAAYEATPQLTQIPLMPDGILKEIGH